MRKWKILALSAIFAFVALVSFPTTEAQAQQCDERAKVIGHLAQKYKEAPIAVGVTSSGGIVEVLTTVDGDTWTIILSNPNGTSCLIAAGEGWRNLLFDNSATDPHV